MLHRPDRRRIPVAFLPNGSGNDTLRAFNIFTIEKALDYIVKGDFIKVDLTKIIIDYESQEDVPAEKINSNLRWQVTNSGFGIPAKVNSRA